MPFAKVPYRAKNIYTVGWVMDAIMLISHSGDIVNWFDARNCLELKLAE
jgi:hypothetical protein